MKIWIFWIVCCAGVAVVSFYFTWIVEPNLFSPNISYFENGTIKHIFWLFYRETTARNLIATALFCTFFLLANKGAREYSFVGSNALIGELAYIASFWFVIGSIVYLANFYIFDSLYTRFGHPLEFQNYLESTLGLIPGVIVGLICGLIGLALAIFMGVMVFFGLAVYSFGVLVLFPFFCIGVYSLFAASSEVTRITERHAKTKRPSNVIETELARAMMSGLKSDLELLNIINEMGPIKRFFNILTYKKKAQKYREIKKFMEAQKESMDEESNLSDTVHQFERAKRRYE